MKRTQTAWLRPVLGLRCYFRGSLKKWLGLNPLLAAAIIASMASVGCGKRKSATVETAPSATKPEAPPAPGRDPSPTPTSDGGDRITQLDGYWVPDKERMLKIYQDAIAAQQGTAVADPAAAAMATQIVEGVLALMFVHIEDGKSKVYSPNGTEESDFKVLAADQNTGVFTVESTSPRGGVKTSTCKVEGDRLTMTVDSHSLVLRRIAPAEFEARRRAIESSAPRESSADPTASAPPSAPTAEETP